MLSERRQFRILYRDFLHRVVDLEVLSAGGEAQNLLVQFAALFAAFSLVIMVVISPAYRLSRLPIEELIVAAWGDEVFLISTTLAVVGVFTLLAWNSLLPERRDSVVLGPLPVRLRTIFVAKSLAVASALGGMALAVNIFSGFGFPTMVNPGGNDLTGTWRCMAAWWITMAAAGLFMFCALQTMQGLASQFLSYRLFLRVSGALQLIAFLAILGVYFLAPSFATPEKLASPQYARWIPWHPAYWFLGLFQTMAGAKTPLMAALAATALRNLAVAAAIAGVTYVLAWRRNIRRIVEQPDIEPGTKRAASRLGRYIVFRMFPGAIDRAIILFSARTIARSRQHRLMLALYGGIGLPLGIAFIRSFLTGASNDRWDRTSPGFLAISLVTMVFFVLGTRAVFSLPQALPSNWIFKITAVHRPATYFGAVRKALYIITVTPVCIAAALFYFAIWPGRPALEHVIVLGLLGMILVEKAAYQYRKIPFACSYLPGGANLKMRAAVYAMVFLIGISVGSFLESWAMAREIRYGLLFTLLLAYAIRCRRRTDEFAASPYNRVQFEDLPDAEVSPLDLRQDGAWSSDEAYVDSIDDNFGRSVKQRLKPFAIGALTLAICGFLYEQTGRWIDHRRYPQIGQSVNIGGRSLNIYCSGEGGPTVIFESGHSQPGLSWLLVQRQVAQFTRACWYDRAGYGWSDPGGRPNYTKDTVRDLRALLHTAHIPGPYVLVGHSLGGFTARYYRHEFPDEVAGMVLVDASHENIRTIEKVEDVGPTIFVVEEAIARLLGPIGLFRLSATAPDSPPRGMTREEWAEIAALQWQMKSQIAILHELPFEANAGPVRRLGDMGEPGDFPLIVLTAGRSASPGWLRLQEGLTHISTRGQQYVIERSGHMMPFDAPDEIVFAVREILTSLRTVPDTSSSVLPVSANR